MKTILVIIIALALLKFVFDFDIIEFIKSPKVAETLQYVWRVIKIIWQDYLHRPFVYIFNLIKDFVARYR